MTDSLAGTGGGPDEGEVPVEERERDAEGVWPRWWEKFREDFKPARKAKANDGLQAPDFPPVEWAQDGSAGTEVILEATRRRLEQAEARTAKAEERADRLVQRSLSLIALDFLILGFVASRMRTRHPGIEWWVLGLTATGLPLVCLGLCAIQAVGVDRVGFGAPAEPEPAATLDGAAQIRNLVAQEARATQMANWSALKKVNEVLQARAWFSRGVAALVVAAAVMAAAWAQGEPAKEDPPSAPPATTSTSVPTTTSAPPATTTTGAMATTSTSPP